MENLLIYPRIIGYLTSKFFQKGKSDYLLLMQKEKKIRVLVEVSLRCLKKKMGKILKILKILRVCATMRRVYHLWNTNWSFHLQALKQLFSSNNIKSYVLKAMLYSFFMIIYPELRWDNYRWLWIDFLFWKNFAKTVRLWDKVLWDKFHRRLADAARQESFENKKKRVKNCEKKYFQTVV